MSNKYEQTPVQENPKARWEKPAVRELRAGARLAPAPWMMATRVQPPTTPERVTSVSR